VTSLDEWKQPRLRETIRAVQAASAVSSLIPLFSREEAILKVLEYYRPDIVHFCESLPAPRSDETTIDRLVRLQITVKRRFPEIRIMRSIPIVRPGAEDACQTLALARCFEPVSDFFLTDTLLTPGVGKDAARQPVSGFVGITGKTCDWQTAAQLVSLSAIPVILAGGISADNVGESIRRVRPAGVDSCTRTNAVDGQGHPIRFSKDPVKVKRLVDEVRAVEPLLG
jgi:phosphoribosylanthranilate isomerase